MAKLADVPARMAKLANAADLNRKVGRPRSSALIRARFDKTVYRPLLFATVHCQSSVWRSNLLSIRSARELPEIVQIKARHFPNEGGLPGVHLLICYVDLISLANSDPRRRPVPQLAQHPHVANHGTVAAVEQWKRALPQVLQLALDDQRLVLAVPFSVVGTLS
jgi:hypothetical protein